MGQSMNYRRAIAAAAVVAAVLATSMTAQAFDDAKYPDLSGQWVAVRLGVRGQPAFDPTKPWGLGQQAPLTPEYQKIWDNIQADLKAGGPGNWPSTFCIPAGMPAMMSFYDPMEMIVLPDITYILISHNDDSYRRIYTDGRGWPTDAELTYAGYSIGQWIDEDGDGKYDVLEVETRFLKGPRALDPAGMPTHEDNASIVKERIYFDKAVPQFLHDEITLIDHAFTRPWTVLKTYRRTAEKNPDWPEDRCDAEGMVMIGKETYYRSGDGTIMPTHKGQAAPDLRYFKSSGK